MAIEITATSSADYLIPTLRMHLWDINEPPTYSSGFLRMGILNGIKLLMPRWNARYVPSYVTTTDNWDIVRSTTDVFAQTDPPRIMYGDERPIILAAAIAIKSGYVFSSSAGTESWKDEEVSYSNITGGKLVEGDLMRDIDELNKIVPERRQRLAQAKKQSLYGYKFPTNEIEG